jgi:hypothetical protein
MSRLSLLRGEVRKQCMQAAAQNHNGRLLYALWLQSMQSAVSLESLVFRFLRLLSNCCGAIQIGNTEVVAWGINTIGAI